MEVPPFKEKNVTEYECIIITDSAGFIGACFAIVDLTKKESVEKKIREKYLAQLPQYLNSFKVYFCKSDNGLSDDFKEHKIKTMKSILGSVNEMVRKTLENHGIGVME